MEPRVGFGQRSFARQRFHGLLVSQVFGTAGALAACFADMVVAGNMVGVDALAGIAAVIPLVTGAQFLAQLVYCGAGCLFARCQGAFDSVGARKVVGLSLETATLVGLAIFVALFFGRDLYLDALGISGSVRMQADLYLRWIAVFQAVSPLTMTMWRLVYADGETVTTAIADTASPILTIVLMVVFTRMTGTAAGAALGVLIGTGVTDLIMILHVFRKSNGIVPMWNFSWHALKELIAYSLADASATLCQCGFMSVVNALIVFSSSAVYLPVAGLIALVSQFCVQMDRIGDAYMPIAEMYLGEGNLPRVRELAHHALAVSVVLGLLAMVAVCLFAPQIVALCGITAGPVAVHGVIALRICAAVLLLSSMLSFLCSHYLVIGRLWIAVSSTILSKFLLAAICAVVFCLAWGLDALWIGVPVGCLLTLGAVFAYGWLRGHQKLPLLLSPDRANVLNLTFAPDACQVVRARDEGEQFLLGCGVCAESVARIALLVEECAMSVVENNREARSVNVEASYRPFCNSGQKVRY